MKKFISTEMTNPMQPEPEDLADALFPTVAYSAPADWYETRQTIGGGDVADVMPYEGATEYVRSDDAWGVRYEDGSIVWLGTIEPETP